MKKSFFILLMCLPFLMNAQNKIKETAVPQAVLLGLEKTYNAYKVNTWYQAPGQYIAELIVDNQRGRSYFTPSGDWQYSYFPVEIQNCPTLMGKYFEENYPGYRIKSIDLVEEMSGDNYYRMIVVRKGLGAEDCEMIFDTRGKLQKSTAPDPEDVKRDFLAQNNPEGDDFKNDKRSQKEEEESPKRRGKPVVDEPIEEAPKPSQTIQNHFNKIYPKGRIEEGPEWVMRGDNYFVAYFENKQGVQIEVVYDIEKDICVMQGKQLEKDRYTSAILKYIDEKFYYDPCKVEKMVVYTYDSKYRDPANGKKPKPYTYVVVSQKDKESGQRGKLKYTRMEFDNQSKFIGLLAQPLDSRDVQQVPKKKRR